MQQYFTALLQAQMHHFKHVEDQLSQHEMKKNKSRSDGKKKEESIGF